MAAENGHSEVVSILLSKSTLQLHVKDKIGRTAMHLSAANGHRELTSQLIGQGADINAPDEVSVDDRVYGCVLRFFRKDNPQKDCYIFHPSW